MSKIKFPFEVKYNGKYYTSNVPFEVELKDIDELISLGGIIIEKNSLEGPNQSKNCNKANTSKQK